MRTTLAFPDVLALEAKHQALAEGTTFTALLVEGLKLRLAQSTRRPLPVSQASGGLVPGVDPVKLQAQGDEDYR